MVETIANELGAILIHLSPDKVKGKFPGKQGPTKLTHMAFTVAKDKGMTPAVIYIEDCEQFFVGGKKAKADKDGAARFKKDLTTYKNQGLGPEDRVIIIGSTSNPENCDIKELKAFFDKFFYFPFPDYATRIILWEHAIREQVQEARRNPPLDVTTSNSSEILQFQTDNEVVDRLLESLDLSALSHVSAGFSADAICSTVRTVLTNRRAHSMISQPFDCNEFVSTLSQQPVSYQDDDNVFREFTADITGLADRQDIVVREKAGEVVETGKKKGGGKKKKK